MVVLHGGDGAHWRDVPFTLIPEQRVVDSRDTLPIRLIALERR
jgi:hypothetical protein